jgi:hypothetical protein
MRFLTLAFLCAAATMPGAACGASEAPPTIPGSTNPGTIPMTPDIVAQLAPHGVLRAGINMSNFLLVTGRSASGDQQGVSP